jgi:hypothetical protein
MTLQTIHEHTFDIEPLQKPGASFLDVGCLDFHHAKAFLGYGCRVCSVDPSPLITEVPEHPSHKYVRKAVVSRANAQRGTAYYAMPDDIYGAYVITGSNPVATPPKRLYGVELTDIVALTAWTGWGNWTAVKLDCEGAEYEILLDWPGPIADQLSVEFHDHTASRNMDQTYQQILAHLGQWYKPVLFNRTGKGWREKELGKNYWDTLFVLKQT